MSVKKNEPAIGGTTASSAVDKSMGDTSSANNYSIMLSECQEQYNNLLDDVWEISALSDDLRTLLDDVLGYFDFKASMYNTEKQRMFFYCDYDIIACKLRNLSRLMYEIVLKLDCIIEHDSDSVLYVKKRFDKMFAFLDKKGENNNDSKN